MLKPSETGSPETILQSSALKISVERGGEGSGGKGREKDEAEPLPKENGTDRAG